VKVSYNTLVNRLSVTRFDERLYPVTPLTNVTGVTSDICQWCNTVSQKSVPPLTCYNLYILGSIVTLCYNWMLQF